jgi:cellulose synthase/poly-beta-1,6-N-acetylglucosamine synthase-like glycosyltransferase
VTSRPSVSAVVCGTAQRSWQQLVAAVNSARDQTLRPQRVVVVIDHNDTLLGRVREHFTGLPDVLVVPNDYGPGSSGTRNTGIRHTGTELVALLDATSTATPDWLEKLVLPFENDPTVVGTGGRVEALWSADSRRPAWLPPEFDWVVGASYRGLPEDPQPVRNVWADNMAVRRDVFDKCGGFRFTFGAPGVPARPQDTDLCVRMSAAGDGGRWIYQPNAVVLSQVPPEQQTLRFFLRRCVAEGRGKAELARLIGPDEALSSERTYLREVVPAAAGEGLHGLGRAGWSARAARSACAVAGVACAGAGYVGSIGRERVARARG